MKIKEVQESFFKYEDQKIILMKETQAFFLKNGFSPYVWVDTDCRLHIKVKHRRGLTYIKNKQNVLEVRKLAQEWAKLTQSKIIWTQNTEYWDESLIGRNKVLCETEIILKVGVENEY